MAGKQNEPELGGNAPAKPGDPMDLLQSVARWSRANRAPLAERDGRTATAAA